jgi:outer membrane protein assembly factor BamB
LIAAAAALPVAARAQQTALVPNDQLPADARESSQGVIVNSSEEARKDLETARNMERQHEWNKAAGWYQEVLEKYRTRVVPWKADPQTQLINRYRGIVYQVQEALAKWPPEGVTLYRARYESAAAAALAEAANSGDDGGASALRQVLDGYFLTIAAKQAAMRLIDLHMEAGEFDAAARVGDLLLDSYPADQLTTERPRVLFRTALAHHLCGASGAAQQRADELKAKFPDATGTVFGKEVVLAEALDGLLKTAPSALASQQTLSPDSWPTFSGSPDRAHVSAAAGQMGAKICSTDLPKRTFRGPQAGEQRMQTQREEEDGRTLGIMPVVDGNALFFQDGARVWAVGLDSGIPLPGWSQTYGGADHKGVYQLKSAASLRNQQWTLTVTDTSVFAVMGQAQRLQWLLTQQGLDPGGDTGTRLVCLERETGRERWKMEIRSITGDSLKDDEKERLRALDLSGSPVVVGDNVFIVARGGKDLQFENCYVLCLDANTGAYRWSCLVASSNSSINVYAGDTSMMTTTLSHLAYASGRLYLLTNLGAIASIDAYNGSVVWLSMYGREGLEGFAGGWGRRAQPMFALPNLRPWEYNPVFVQDGKLFVLPADGKHLLVYDAADGRELKRINVEDFTPESMREGQMGTTDRPRALVAVMGDQLVLTGSWFAYSLDWTKYDNTRTFAKNAETDAVRPSTPLGSAHRQSLPPAGSIRGRAFVTADSVFVPTDTQLYRLSLRKGLLVEDTYPRNGQEWDESEGPGNVLVTEEHVVIANRNSVDVYTDMTLARAKLDAEEAAARDDAEPRLHYAEVMFAAGQSQTSLQKLDEAATLLGGIQSMRPGLNRQRLFNDALTFAQKLAREQRGESIEAAVRYFDVAASAADLPSEQVQYRLARARFARQNVTDDSFAIAVRLYQEILGRPELRTVGVVPDDTQQQAAAPPPPLTPPLGQPVGTAVSSNDARAVVQAAVEAENQIADVMRFHPEAYAPIEEQAAAAMEKALANHDAGKLLAIAQTYPNASVAPKAMLQAAESYEQGGDARQAAHVLRQIYRKYGNNAERARIVEAMVRNYLALPGGFDIAIARLQRARSFGDKLSRPLALPDGTKLENLSFRDAVTQLIAARPPEPPVVLPDVHVPFYTQLTLDEREAGKKPEKPLLLGAADPHPILIPDIDALVQPPAELPDAIRGDRIVVGQRQGAAAWAVALFAPAQDKPLGSADGLADAPKNAAWFHASAADHQSILLAWSNVELVAIDGQTAALKWKTPLSALAPAEIVSAAGLQGADVTNDTIAAINNQQLEEQQQFINARRGQFIGGRRRFPRGIPQLQPAQPNAPEVEAVAAGPEQIMHVRPLGGDAIVAATSTGRVACLGAPSGKLLWQARVSPRPIERLVASEDFTVVRVTEEQTVRLIVLDNYNGQVLMVRNFAVDSQITPVNMALSPDGMLVWTLPDRLCGKDLYEPETRKLTFEYPSPPRDAGNPNGTTGSTIYAGCSKPGQLLIRGSQIIALQEQGRFITVHSLEDGSILKHRSGKETIETKLQTLLPPSGNGVPGGGGNANEVNVTLRLAGSYLYAMSPRSLIAYNLDHPATGGWHPEIGQMLNPNFQAVVPTHDFVLVAGEPGARQQFQAAAAANAAAPNPAPTFQLRFYSRKLVKVDDGSGGQIDGESGAIEQMENLTDPTGVLQWQAAEGGVYYLANDRRLHFVRGSRP